MSTRDELTDDAEELVAQMLAQLHRDTGIPPDCILAGAHAAVIWLIADMAGGPVAARLSERAAEQVRNMPPREGVALALAVPAGQA